MRTARKHATAALTLAGLGTIAAAFLAGPAAAATTPTGLTFLPAKGLASTPMTVLIPQGCPADSTNVIAQAFGHGFPAAGQTVITNSTAGVSRKAPFALPLQDTFTGFAADNGTVLSGPYRVTLRCINRLGNKTYASFTATVTFADAAHFTAPAPTDALVNEIQQAEQPAPIAPQQSASSGKNSSPSGKSSAKGGQSTTAGSGTTGATNNGTASGGTAATQTAKKKAGFPWQATLVIAAFVLIGLGIALRIREVRSNRPSNRPGNRHGNRARPAPRSDGSSSSTEKTSKTTTLTGSGSARNHGKGHQS